jgi:HSP20 family molecular chaperone IbpA
MTLMPHTAFPRSKFDTDLWHNFGASHLGPSTLDLFDPFDELDHTISRNLNWLNKPEFMPQLMMPKVPQKYRVVCDVTGYAPKSIKTEIKGHMLHVIGKEDVKMEGGDFSTKEFKRTFTLPEHTIVDKMASFITGQGQLVIEFPLKETETHLDSDLFPKVVDVAGGGKAVNLNFAVPANIHPDKVHVTIKDRDLIVKAEDKIEKPDGSSKVYYYKRTTMPENTDFNALKCTWANNNKLSVSAPIKTNFLPYKKVPIEIKNK